MKIKMYVFIFIFISLFLSLPFISREPSRQVIYVRNHSNQDVKIIVTYGIVIDNNEEVYLPYINNLLNEINYRSHKSFREKIYVNRIDDNKYWFIIKPRTTVLLKPLYFANPIEKVEIFYDNEEKTIIFYGKDFNRKEMEKIGVLEYKYPLVIINIK